MPDRRPPSRHVARRLHRRFHSGAVILEVILAMPLLMIALLAIVEFGVMLVNLQYLEFASRTGAQVASQLNQSDFYSPVLPNPPVFPAAIAVAVNTQLNQATPNAVPPLTSSSILLEHSVPLSGPGVAGSAVEVSNGVPVTSADVAEPPVPAPPAYRYVRVTVFVDADELTPNLLAAFGFDLTGKRFQQTTTYAYLK